jgi:hypothetical protein
MDDPQDDSARIRANVEKMRAAKAPDADIEHYLANVEGLKPTVPEMAGRDATSAQPRIAKPKQSLGDAVTGAAEKFQQGATFGLADEAKAVAAGFALNPLHPLKNYEKLRQQINAPAKQFAEEHPVLAGASELGGALAEGGASALLRGGKILAKPAMGMAAKLIRGAKDIGAGAVGGAAMGAGTAEPGQRIEGAEHGALAGGGTVAGFKGAGALVKATGVPQLIRNVMPRPATNATTAGKVFQKLGGLTTDDLAHADVLKQLERAGLSVDDAAANAATGHPEQMLLDPSIGGKSMMRRARGAQSIPSKGSEQIEGALTARVQGQPARVQQSLEETMGHTRGNTVLRAEQLKGERLAHNSPKYQAIQGTVIDDPDVIALFDIPEFRAVHRSIARNAEIRGEAKIAPLSSKQVIDGVESRVQNPQTLGTLDRMKQHIDGIIAGKIDGGKVTRDRAYAMRDRLIQARDRLDELHPAYKDARAGWAEDSKALAGQESGLDFMKSSRDELAAHFPRMAPQEQAEFRRSALAQIEDEMARVTDGRDVTARFQNPLMREKLSVLFPTPAAYQQFVKSLEQEGAMHKTAREVLSGSPTARILAEQGDQVGGGLKSIGATIRNPANLIVSALDNAATRRMRGLGEQQVNAMAPLLTAKGDNLTTTLERLKLLSGRQTGGAAKRNALLHAAGITSSDQTP